VRIPVGNDGLCQREADPRKPGKLRSISRVGIQTFIGTERTSLVDGTIAMSVGRAGRQDRQELNLSWSLRRPRGEVPHTLADHRQAEKKEDGFAFGGEHAKR
jgi:hypothetical protein